MIKGVLDEENENINSIQASYLYGRNKVITVEISNRGYYLGSNVSYNLKKMIENGYVNQTPDKVTGSFYISLSSAGKKLCKILQKVETKKNLFSQNLQKSDLAHLFTHSQKIESFLSHNHSSIFLMFSVMTFLDSVWHFASIIGIKGSNFPTSLSIKWYCGRT